MSLKVCPKCSASKDADSEFNADKHQADGRFRICKQCRQKSTKPPLEAVPEGFHVSHVGTLVDEQGNTEKQWIGAKPEPIASAEHQPAIPTGHIVKGVSSLLDGQGKLIAQWVKTKDGSGDPVAMLLEAMKDIDCWSGKSEPSPWLARPVDDDLMCIYPMGDPHIGMFAWGAETGANHDVKIAERDLYTAVDHLVQLAPHAKRALIVSVGDFFHADNRGNTTTGGTPVDSDGRWPKVLAAGIRLMRRVIDRALEKHEQVTVICEIGNHDWHTSIVLATCLAQFYEREPRVTIDTSPAKFHWYRFGANLIGTTHGDTVKLDELGGVMACDRPHDWGETKHRYWLTGHIHHTTVKELKGCIVESFRTLAPADAWHRGQGYRSGQEMTCLVMDKQDGVINRHTVGIAQIRRKIELINAGG